MSATAAELLGLLGRARTQIPGATGADYGAAPITLTIDDGDADYSSSAGFTAVSTVAGSIENGPADYLANFRYSSTSTWIAQSIVATADGDVESVSLELEGIGSPVGDVWVEIYTDSGGDPDAITGSASDTIDATTMGTRQSYTFEWSSGNPSLTADVTYYIVLKSDVPLSTSNFFFYWQTYDNLYVDGSVKRWNGSAWSDYGTLNDLVFTLVYSGASLDDAYQGDAESAPAGSGSETATWTFQDLPPTLSFIVYASYPTVTGVATDAPFTMSGKATGSVDVNQNVNPGIFTAIFINSETTLGGDLVITLSDDANSTVLADAIRIMYIPAEGQVDIIANPDSFVIISDGFSLAQPSTEIDCVSDNLVLAGVKATVENVSSVFIQTESVDLVLIATPATVERPILPKKGEGYTHTRVWGARIFKFLPDKREIKHFTDEDIEDAMDKFSGRF